MSLFKKPAWAQPQSFSTEADDAARDIFRHSERSYREIVTEQERRKKEKSEKRKSQEKAPQSPEKQGKGTFAREVSPKRRRITLEDGEALLKKFGMSPALDVSDVAKHTIEGTKQAPVRKSPRHERYVNRVERQTVPTDVVELGDSSDVEPGDNSYASAASMPVQIQSLDDESDDEFAELARRARQRQHRTAHQSRGSDPAVGSSSTLDYDLSKGDPRSDSPNTPAIDPVVELLITSRIPNTSPLIVHRKLSQRLQEIRLAWCQRQGFSQDFTKTVFFTYRMRRVYDVTTCRSLGLDVDPSGNVTAKGMEDKEGVERVHLEAVTDDIFRALKAERIRKAQACNENLEDQEQAQNDETAQQVAPLPQEEEPLIRIVLKAKDREDLRLKVRATTLFSRIAVAYSKQRDVSVESIRFEFDGEALNFQDSVQITDITDLDCIDVYVNP